MKHTENKDYYLQRRTKQLHQWDKVIAKLIARAEQEQDKSNTALRHHIIKIQVKKARTEIILRQLEKERNGTWGDIKAKLEKSWLELREAFLKASAPTK